MKTRIIQPTEQKPEQPIKYPCLMMGRDGTIILAANKTDGMVLHWPDSLGGSLHVITGGEEWTANGYTPMLGKVVIEFDMEDGQ